MPPIVLSCHLLTTHASSRISAPRRFGQQNWADPAYRFQPRSNIAVPKSGVVVWPDTNLIGKGQNFMQSRQKIASVTFWIWLLSTTVTSLGMSPLLHGQTLNVIHNFVGTSDGEYPVAGLTIDPSGTLYGTTAGLIYTSGPSYGSVFRVKLHNGFWIFTPLYDFSGGTGGGYPLARVVIGSNGSLYGTANRGGINNCTQGCGLVFNLRPSPTIPPSPLTPWTETVLYSFNGGTDGAYPGYGPIVFDQSGTMYNTASQGGLNNCPSHVGCGVVYKITHSGGTYTESALYAFTGGADGAFPIAGTSFDASAICTLRLSTAATTTTAPSFS
jgi:hypothetical protein